MRTEQAPTPTLYEWIGGIAALERLTVEFYARVAKDELLAPVFARVDRDHPTHVAAFIAEVLGGPKLYSERFGGVGVVLARHRRFTQTANGISADQAGD